MRRLMRGSAWLLVPLLFAAGARTVLPASDAATLHAGVFEVMAAEPGLPVLGSGSSQAELLPRDSALRPPVRAPRASAPRAMAGTAAKCRATAACREHLDHAQALRALRRNLPSTYGTPPPSSRS